MNTKPPLVVIAGPTASGKSALALALSRLTPSVIVNADASQVYADLRILTARPTEAEEAETPHRLFGQIDGARACSAAEWAADAKAAIAETHAAGRLPILVGGTGLYIRTLLDGIAPVPEIDPAIRKKVRGLAIADAYAALSLEDPAAAARLNPADSSRISRALEVVRSTGRPLAEWQQRREGGIGEAVRVVPMILLPPRDWLHARIDARFETMFSTAQEEVAALLARKLPPGLPVMRAIGVDALDPDFLREHGADAALTTGQARSRQYAKRQYTWFRRQLPPDWPRYEQQLDSAKVNELAIILRDQALTA